MSIFCKHEYIPVKIYDRGIQRIECGDVLSGFQYYSVHVETVKYKCIKCNKKIFKNYHNGILDD